MTNKYIYKIYENSSLSLNIEDINMNKENKLY